MIAFKVGASFSDNWMICETLEGALETVRQEYQTSEIGDMAAEGDSYSILPIEMTDAAFKEIHDKEFPGW